MKKYSFPKFYGYTIIEILIVVSISIIIFSVVYSNYRSFARRQSLEEITKIIVSDLRLTQEYALSGRNQAGCNTLLGYEFERASSNGYRINNVCVSGGGTEIKSITLPTDFQMGNFSPNPNRFYFRSLARGTNRDSDVVITISQSSTGASKQITISKTGSISTN